MAISLHPDDVARYLQDHPRFFEDYADLLSHIVIAHPHGGRAISITERLILSLREKTKALESKLGELIRFGEENDAIGEKVHRLAVVLAGVRDFATGARLLQLHLREDFAVPHVALRLWDVDGPGGAEFEPVSEPARVFAAGLARPYCGPAARQEALAWFGEAGEHLRSLAQVPIRREAQTVGLLVLASEDGERFYAEMGTLYLTRIGELVAAALLRTLG